MPAVGFDMRRVAAPSYRRGDSGAGRAGEPVASQKASNCFLGDAYKAAVEELQDIGEGRAMTAILWHDQMSRFVQHQKVVKVALLDGDAMVGDIGKAADPGVVETGDQGEFGRRAVAGGEDVAQHLRRGVVVDEAVARGVGG